MGCNSLERKFRQFWIAGKLLMAPSNAPAWATFSASARFRFCEPTVSMGRESRLLWVPVVCMKP
jgi:hypothetical protein